MTNLFIKKIFNQIAIINQSKRKLSKAVVIGGLLGLSTLFSMSVFSADPILAEKPLGKTAGTIKPNLMFVFDTSGSMSKDLANDILTDWGQCKAADKNVNGLATVSQLTIGPTTAFPLKPNTRLTIFAPGLSKNVGDIIYLTTPGKPTLSGVYTIQKKNVTSTACVSGGGTNTTTTINNPYKYNEITAAINAPAKYNQITAAISNPSKIGEFGYTNGDPGVNGCQVNTSAPTNSGSTTTDLYLGGGFVVGKTGVTTTPSGSCYWRDLKDTSGCSVTGSAPANNGSTTTTLNLGGGVLVQPNGTVTATADSRCYWRDPKDNTGCKVTGSQPANSGSTTTSYNLGGGVLVQPDGTVTATVDSRCYWYDPLDNAVGTVTQACTTGTVGENSYEVDIATDTPATYSTASSSPEVVDARVVNYQDDSTCRNEPPIRAAKVNTLAYDPSVRYSPPPSPKKVGQGLPAPLDADLPNLNSPSTPHNLLPSMDATYTSNWRLVLLDGTKLNASGVPDTTSGNIWGGATASTSNVGLASASNGMGFNRWTEMVFCDTADRPAAFANDRLWLESSRCQRNIPGANTVLQSPNWPYKYPANTSGLANIPNQTNWQLAPQPHQNGQAKGAKNPVFDFGGGTYYVFGEDYNYAVPYYYSIKPIEFCTQPDLKICNIQSAADATYTEPSYVRYCKTQVQATDTQNAQSGNCQALYTGSVQNTDYKFARYGLFEKTEIKSSVTSYPKDTDRKDCAAATCTYAEEMTNFANWFAYYRTRMQLMKSAVGRTFDSLNEDYRVGLITVEDYNIAGNYMPIKDFVTGTNYQKENWFNSLYSRTPSGGTSLRDVLGTVGRIYAGKKPITGFTATTDDPVQYACQKNYTLLSTDGYWNGPAGQKIDGSAIGNQDAAPTPRPQREGAAAVDTLADVAQYYYETDIRDTLLGNCTGALGDDVCLNNVKATSADAKTTQHMVTFTLGLGVDGQLNSTNYLTSTTGDFAGLKDGSVTWPVPGPDNGDTTFTPAERATVDDLWHAAVNGHGTYYSARNPQQLIAGISATLEGLGDALGTGSATALSNTTPVAGDNYAYSARYVTGTWTGNLFARTISGNGTLSANAVWCVENEASVSPACSADATTGLVAKVNAGSRRVLTNINGVIDDFKYNLLTTTQQAYFNTSHINTLSQWSSYNPYQLSKVGGDSLVKYLRGETTYDRSPANNLNVPPATTGDNRLYRKRGALLGDIVDSDPIFVGTAQYDYLNYGSDVGYQAWRDGFTAGRQQMVYVGANDGMLHAFDAHTGEEKFAFVPNTTMPNMWKLADEDYRNTHTNFVNAKMTVADVFLDGGWKTILVSGFGQGGRGYFALDITNPAASDYPKLLWEIDSSTEPNIGYTYGKPVVTKKPDGTWVVLLTSGYNNDVNGDGQGRLFVRKLSDGTMTSIPTTASIGGSTPSSGLAQVSAYATSNPIKNNQAQFVYGGDLLGNVWRFDLTANTVMKLTTLVDATSNAQPITVAPTLGEIKNKRTIFIGTGKYLEAKDLMPINYSSQTIYGIIDNNVLTEITGLRSTLIEQTLSNTTGTRTGSSNGQNTHGWYVDLPGSGSTGERESVTASLISGALFVPTFIPPTDGCGVGTGWLNVFNYETGGAVDPSVSNVVSTQTSSPMAGLYFVFDPIANPEYNKVSAKGDYSDGSVANCTPPNCDPTSLTPPGKFIGTRSIWRELVQ